MVSKCFPLTRDENNPDREWRRFAPAPNRAGGAKKELVVSVKWPGWVTVWDGMVGWDGGMGWWDGVTAVSSSMLVSNVECKKL